MNSMTNRRNTEDAIQRVIFQHLDLRGAPDMFAFHPANGGYRSKVGAAILKHMGVKAGVPDIVAVKGGKMFALELKADSGRVTDVQKAVHAALRRAGAYVAVAFGLDAALEQLKQWNLIS
jgi:hypothetical protein